jgi:GntR family transcriptional regulator/MocR family aminotransferase
MISSGTYDRHVRRCRIEYRSRRDALVAALPRHLTPRGISAGLHLLLPLSTSAEAEARAAARRQSMAIEPLSPQRIQPHDQPGGLIVGYGAPPRHAFGGAVAALLDVLREIDGHRVTA